MRSDIHRFLDLRLRRVHFRRGWIVCVVVTLAFVTQSSNVVAQGVIAVSQPESYRGYWPGSCVEAVDRSTAFFYRTGPDTTRYDVSRDTLLPAVMKIAKECAAVFSPDAVVARDLVLFGSILLSAGDDARARDVIMRRIAGEASKPTEARAVTLRDIVVAYASARPARMADARQHLVALDALTGSDAARERVIAHSALAWAILRTGDTAALRMEAEAIITAGQAMSADDRVEMGGRILFAYEYLRDITGAGTGTSDAPRAVIARAREDLGKVQGYQYAIEAYDAIAGLYGTAAPRVEARYWTGVSPGDTVRPRAGKPSLVIFDVGRDNVPGLRRLAAHGLEITLVRSTRGHFAGRGPLEVEAEAQALRKHYLEELAVPGAFALTVTEYDRIPDGRRVRRPTRNEIAYTTQSGVWGVLVDRQGIIRRVYPYWMPWTELRIEEALRTFSN